MNATVELLAVPIQIQAAVIGGLVTGGVLLAGVVLTEWLIRLRERRTRLVHAVHRLTLLVPVVMTYLSVSPPDSRRLGTGSPGWYFQQEMLDALFEADVLVRSPRSRANREVRQALDDLWARITTATTGALAGRYLTTVDVLEISTSRLTEAVHGERNVLGDRAGDELPAFADPAS